jgi:hypothetical protein
MQGLFGAKSFSLKGIGALAENEEKPAARRWVLGTLRRNKEAIMNETRFWRVMGLGSMGGGIALLAVAYFQRSRFAWETALAVGLAAAFIMLAGSAAMVASNVMEAIASGKAACAGLMRGMGWLTIVVGTAVVAWVGIKSWGVVPSVKEIAMGAAGSFVLMFGILHLLGERMVHAVGGGKAAGA